MFGIGVEKLSEAALTPTFSNVGDACFDLYAVEDTDISILKVTPVKTGLKFEIPEGYVMKVYPRSGLATKHGVTLANCVGIIDSGYRGEVMVPLYSLFMPYHVKMGDRIAQAEITKVTDVVFIEKDHLSKTERGEGGFGSSGR